MAEEAPMSLRRTGSSLRRSQMKTGAMADQSTLWERVVAGDIPKQFPACCCVSMCIIILLVAVIAGATFKLSDEFGFFVQSEPLVQAYFSHQKATDIDYFSDLATPSGPQAGGLKIPKRAIPATPAQIIVEARGTKCPGDDCDLKSKNALTAAMIGHLHDFEKKLWDDRDFQEKYCALVFSSNPPHSTKCYPPTSLTQLLYFGQPGPNAAPAQRSNALEQLGFGNNAVHNCTCKFSLTECPDCPSSCSSGGASCAACSYVSPLANGGVCASPAWASYDATSGAKQRSDFTQVLTDLCDETDAYYSSLRAKILPNFACANSGSYVRDHGVPFLRSMLFFGFPVKEAQLGKDIDKADESKLLQDDYGAAFYVLIKEAMKKALDASNDELAIIVSSNVISNEQSNEIQQSDLSLTVASLVFVFLYMWFNVESMFLAACGMFQIFTCVFPTAIIWNILSPGGVQFLQMLAIFMILGIGADDVFVLNDAYNQVYHEERQGGEEEPQIMSVFSKAYRRAFSAMLATTSTTALAFLLSVTNPIPAIRDFCVFAAIIVIFDFIWCITFFAAALVFYHRFLEPKQILCFGTKAEPGQCCYKGCCWGLVPMISRKVRKICTGSPEKAEGGTLEEFFTGALFNKINRFKVPLIIFWIVLLIAAIISFSLGVKIAKENPEGLPSDHPVQRAMTIQSNYFVQENPERVNVIWGLDQEAPTEEWETVTEVKSVRYGDTSAAVSKEGQVKLLRLCKAPDLETGRRCQDESCLVKGQKGACAMKTVVTQAPDNPATSFTFEIPQQPLCQTGRYCIMEQVKDYTVARGKPFPVEHLSGVLASHDFKSYMRTYFRMLQENGRHWDATNYRSGQTGSGVVLDDPKVKYMWVTFNATWEGRFLPPDEGAAILDNWDSFVKGHVDGTNFFQVHIMYLFKLLQDVLLREAVKSIVISLLVGFATLVAVTWNWYISLFGLFNITVIIIYFLGLWPVIQWDLDLYNIIFLIMSVGLAVDYTVHLLHAFNESQEEDRVERTRGALGEMGITVFSGAITTLLAAIPLFLCQSTFFKRFGTFIFFTIGFSILLALFFLIPLLLLIGPQGSFGDVAPFYWLAEKCRSTSDKVECASGNTPEPEVFPPSNTR